MQTSFAVCMVSLKVNPDVPAKGSSPRPARCTSRRLRWLIEATDRQIDALVYELYGLTEEEIRIVEGEK